MHFHHVTKSILSLSLCLAAGCASIVSGGPKTLPIVSHPDDAVCEIVDTRSGTTILKTRTPFTATLPNDAGFFQNAKYRVKISKNGYLPREVPVEAGINGWYFGNIIFGGLLGILVVDPATGAMWKIHKDSVSVTLYPDTPEGRNAMQEEERMRMAEEKEHNTPHPPMGM
ncbi:MAG: hypothetical protein GYA56_13880 [Geobacteraceae bacterium]|nr:hypothetical protein [Geobacteraceae bacterium]